MEFQYAIKAAKMMNCKNIIGIHYNTFPPITINTEEAIKKFADAGITLHLLKIGESLELQAIAFNKTFLFKIILG